MSAKRDIDLFLLDILDEIKSIQLSVSGLDYEEVITNNDKLKAIKYSLIIIGEAVSKLPKELTDKYAHIKWREIKDMRNKIIHEYFGTNVKAIWGVIQQELDPLMAEIQKILKNEFPDV